MSVVRGEVSLSAVLSSPRIAVCVLSLVQIDGPQNMNVEVGMVKSAILPPCDDVHTWVATTSIPTFWSPQN